MKKLSFLIIFTLIFTLAGCRDSACYDKLKEVDSLSEKGFTDSAQKALEVIEQTYKIKEGKDRAYYSLLKYQLQFRFQYKNNSYPVDDNLIDYSIAYYKEHNDNHKLALSYYLKGRVRRNLNQNKDAIKYLKKSELIAKNINDNYLKMRIYSNITPIIINNEDYETALKYGLEAIKYGEYTNKTDLLVQCYLNLSCIYSNLGKSDSASFYTHKCVPHFENIEDEQKSSIYIHLATSVMDIDTIKAKEYALKSLDIEKTNNAYQILAKIARDNKDYKLSEAYLNEALKYSPSIDWEAFILYELAQTKTLMGKHEEATRISKEVHRLRDSVEYLHAQDSIKELQMAADLNHKHQTVVKEKDSRTAIIAFALTAIIIITLGAYIRKRRRLKRSITDSEQKENEYKNKINTIEEKNKEIEEENRKKDKEIEAARRKAEKARKDKEAAKKEAETVRKTAKKQQEKMKAEEERRKMEKEKRFREGMDIYNKVVDGTAGSIYWDKETETSFVEYYQLLSPKFKKDIDNKYAGMTERNLVILAMKDMKLTNAAIAKTLNISDGAVRTQISRMNKGTKDDMADE